MKLPEQIVFFGNESPASTLAELFLQFGIEIVLAHGPASNSAGLQIANSIKGMDPDENIVSLKEGELLGDASINFLALGPDHCKALLEAHAFNKEVTLIFCGKETLDSKTMMGLTEARLVRAFHLISEGALRNPIFSGLKASLFFWTDSEEAIELLHFLAQILGLEGVYAGQFWQAEQLTALPEFFSMLARRQGGDICLKVLRRN